MARMPWLHSVAGLGLMVAIGCQTAPTNTGTPPRFPTGPTNTTPTNPSASRAPTSPSPAMPSMSSDSPRISTPTGQGTATNTPARLRPLDPSTPQQFNDWQAGQRVTPPAAVQPTSAIAPPASQTSLQNRMPTPSFGQQAPIAPPFPTQPPLPTSSFENPTNPAGAFPTANLPAAPNLAPTPMSPSAYQSGLR